MVRRAYDRGVPDTQRTRRVTIGLPVYNGERFLRDALDSILAQTFGDFALVVSDNASTDATVEIVEGYAARDDRIVLLRSDTNRGAAWNYNRVLAAAHGPYFKWAAADDMLAPTCVERSVEILDASSPSVVLAYPRTQVIDADGTVVGTIDDDLASAPGAPPHVRLRKVIRNIVFGNVIFAMVRSDALRRTRLHGNYPTADYVLIAELALAGEFVAIPEPLFLRRLHEGTSVRANPTATQLAEWFDPQRKPVRSRSATLFREHIAAIRHADLAPVQRALTYAAFVASWTRRQAKPRTRVRRLLGRLPR
jgi:glycosyltransferase involved in cell wall biosynthesis